MSMAKFHITKKILGNGADYLLKHCNNITLLSLFQEIITTSLFFLFICNGYPDFNCNSSIVIIAITGVDLSKILGEILNISGKQWRIQRKIKLWRPSMAHPVWL